MNISEEECQSKNDLATFVETSINFTEIPSLVKKKSKKTVKNF